MEQQFPFLKLTFWCAALLGVLIGAGFLLSGCAATGGATGAAKEAVCAVHNSKEMIQLCEDPVRK